MRAHDLILNWQLIQLEKFSAVFADALQTFEACIILITAFHFLSSLKYGISSIISCPCLSAAFDYDLQFALNDAQKRHKPT